MFIGIEKFYSKYKLQSSRKIHTGNYDISVYDCGDYIVKQGKLISLLSDLTIMCRFKHPSIIHPRNISYNPDNDILYIAMIKGDPYDIVKHKNHKQYLYQILDALSVIYQYGYIHGDVKLDNIIIHDDTAILIDFGLSTTYLPNLPDMGKYQGVAYTAGYDRPDNVKHHSVWNSARGDLYAYAKLIQEIDIDDPLLLDLTDILLNDRYHSYQEILCHPYFEEKRQADVIVMNPIYEQCTVDDKMYSSYMQWLLFILKSQKISLCVTFSILTNMQRSFSLLDNSNILLWMMAHLCICDTILPSNMIRESRYSILCNSTYSVSEIHQMIIAITQHMKGVLLVPTYWNTCGNPDLLQFYMDILLQPTYYLMHNDLSLSVEMGDCTGRRDGPLFSDYKDAITGKDEYVLYFRYIMEDYSRIDDETISILYVCRDLLSSQDKEKLISSHLISDGCKRFVKSL